MFPVAGKDDHDIPRPATTTFPEDLSVGVGGVEGVPQHKVRFESRGSTELGKTIALG